MIRIVIDGKGYDFDNITPVVNVDALKPDDCVAFVQDEDVVATWRVDDPEKGKAQLIEMNNLISDNDVEIRLFRLEAI